MQEKLTIARPYASAAFSFAKDHAQIDVWSAMLGTLGTAIQVPVLRRLLRDPRVKRAQLRELLFDLLGRDLTAEGRNFIEVLLDAERLELASEIGQLFERYKADAEGVVDVEVTSAFAMDAAEQNKIASAVRARIGQDVEVVCVVNRDLIGGIVIRIGDSVMDLSLRGRLDRLAQQLA